MGNICSSGTCNESQQVIPRPFTDIEEDFIFDKRTLHPSISETQLLKNQARAQIDEFRDSVYKSGLSSARHSMESLRFKNAISDKETIYEAMVSIAANSDKYPEDTALADANSSLKELRGKISQSSLQTKDKNHLIEKLDSSEQKLVFNGAQSS